jgi:hypothetical protein
VVGALPLKGLTIFDLLQVLYIQRDHPSDHYISGKGQLRCNTYPYGYHVIFILFQCGQLACQFPLIYIICIAYKQASISTLFMLLCLWIHGEKIQ